MLGFVISKQTHSQLYVGELHQKLTAKQKRGLFVVCPPSCVSNCLTCVFCWWVDGEYWLKIVWDVGLGATSALPWVQQSSPEWTPLQNMCWTCGLWPCWSFVLHLSGCFLQEAVWFGTFFANNTLLRLPWSSLYTFMEINEWLCLCKSVYFQSIHVDSSVLFAVGGLASC